MSKNHRYHTARRWLLKVGGLGFAGMIAFCLALPVSAEMTSLSDQEMVEINAAPGLALPLPGESETGEGVNLAPGEGEGVDYRRIRDDALTSGRETGRVSPPGADYPVVLRERTTSVTYPEIRAGSGHHTYTNVQVRETRHFSP